jgi:hypothetical protein
MSKYPEVVERIHKEFMTAGDLLLQQANEILKQCDETDYEKGLRLKSAGFSLARQVSEFEKKALEVEKSREMAATVREYAMAYPTAKFITDEQVATICKKYNLVCADVSRYTVFVPDKNLKQIEAFSLRFTKHLRKNIAINFKFNYDHNKENFNNNVKKGEIVVVSKYEKGIHYFDGYRVYFANGDYENVRSCDTIDNTKLVICAPKKDMNLKGMKGFGFSFFELKKVEVPDPVVLQPVVGGYIIVTAWGDEASDPIVVNERNN